MTNVKYENASFLNNLTQIVEVVSDVDLKNGTIVALDFSSGKLKAKLPDATTKLGEVFFVSNTVLGEMTENKKEYTVKAGEQLRLFNFIEDEPIIIDKNLLVGAFSVGGKCVPNTAGKFAVKGSSDSATYAVTLTMLALVDGGNKVRLVRETA